MFREKNVSDSAAAAATRRVGARADVEDVARRAERRARASERTRVEGALPRSGEETKGGLVRVPSRMSSARASAAEVGIFAAGPDTPTLWPLRRRISSQSPTLVPRRVIIAGGYVVRMCEVGGGADVQVLGGGTPGACWVVPSSYLIV